MMKKILSLMLVLSLVISTVACASSIKKNIDQTMTEEKSQRDELEKDDEKKSVNDDEKKESNTEENAADESISDKTDDVKAEEVEILFKDYVIDNSENSVTYIDKFGKETTVTKNPEKVVIAYNSILGLWYFAGGESLTKVKGSTNVPEEAMDLIDLGSVGDLSLEAIIAQEPDLVILAANYESQVAMAPSLNEMGIETMIVDIATNSYERFKENAYLFSLINNSHEIYVDKLLTINETVDEIVEKALANDSSPKVAAIFASNKSIKLESDLATVGEMINILGGSNIVDEADVPSGETRIDFSIEALVSKNPEIITISTMGSVEDVKANIENMIEENPVWNEVDAVKNGRVYYLPKEYSVYKANELYAQAFELIAEILYPEIFGE